MSYTSINEIFMGVKLKDELADFATISELLEEYLKCRIEANENDHAPTEDIPQTSGEELRDDWHDSGYVIDSEFADGVYIGFTIKTFYDDSESGNVKICLPDTNDDDYMWEYFADHSDSLVYDFVLFLRERKLCSKLAVYFVHYFE